MTEQQIAAGPAALSASVLRQYLATLLAQKPALDVVGIRSGPWSEPETMDVRDRRCRIIWCPSSLALREQLRRGRGDGELLVLLTDRSEPDLGADVLARLPKRRLVSVDPWRVLLDLYDARSLDSRLVADTWLAEALLEVVPAAGLAPGATGSIDLDRVWGDLLEHRFGFAAGRSDLSAVLRWVLDDTRVALFLGSEEEVRRAVARRLGVTAGPAGPAVVHLVETAGGADAVAVGLACRVLFSEEAEGEAKLRESAVRLESRLGERRLDPAAARHWADAAESLVRELLGESSSPQRGHQLLARGDAVLEELGAAAYAHLSPVLPSGLQGRVERYAASLSEGLKAGPARSGEAVEAAARRLGEHERWHGRRGVALEMSLRLLRWLARREALPSSASSLPGAALAYVHDGAFVDWARGALHAAEANRVLAPVYERLLLRVGEARERENARFGELLKGWLEARSESPELVPVEQVLAAVVAPLARRMPVLLLVIDGMSLAVYHELMADLLQRGWMEVLEGEEARKRYGLAALPSVTDVCRGALLTGRLQRGAQSREKAGFERHADLTAASAAELPPVLFHKAELREDRGAALAGDLRREIARPARRVVGVVINAVDDLLMHGDQVVHTWSADAIKPLAALLDEAAAAGRAVIVTSDHGHVPETGLERRSVGKVGQRHRPAAGEIVAGEMEVDGPRVIDGPVVVPWSERLRYCDRLNGYHGGASPQEMLLPISVLIHAELKGVDLRPAPGSLPEWWEPGAPAPSPATAKARPVKPARRKKREELPARQVPLFEPADAESWIDRLLASPVYGEQRALAGPARLDEERVRSILGLVDHHGGRLSSVALARALNLPAGRLRGVLAALQRLLNVEGYAVVAVDEESVTLDRRLLDAQFEIEGLR